MAMCGIYCSPIGEIHLTSDGENLTGLWLDGQKYFGGAGINAIHSDNTLPVFVVTAAWLDRYFAGNQPASDELPLAPGGSAFRQTVWKLLCEIPYGTTTTYGAIAVKVAELQHRERVSAQAVGGAVAHNPISIIIPCHRVVGKNGSLTGYAGGLERKEWLLRREGIRMTEGFVLNGANQTF